MAWLNVSSTGWAAAATSMDPSMQEKCLLGWQRCRKTAHSARVRQQLARIHDADGVELSLHCAERAYADVSTEVRAHVATVRGADRMVVSDRAARGGDG